MNHLHVPGRTRTILVGALVAACVSMSLTAADKPRTVKLAAKDTAGKTIVVPQADRPSLLLFLRADQEQSHVVVAEVKRVLTGLPDVQTLVLLCGKQPDAATSRKFLDTVPWPVVMDPKYDLVGKLEIRVWPSCVLAMPDGTELTRLTGLPQSYVDDLGAYLEFATKKIDRKTLDQKLAASTVITDSPHQIAGRHLRMSNRLLEKGLADQALRELEQGLRVLPKDPPLLLGKARALLLLRRPTEAMNVLDGMDEKSSLAGKIGVLKGGVLVAIGKWDEAIRTLQMAIKLNPDRTEGNYFLGVAYENTGRQAEAAKAFRAAFEDTTIGRTISVPLKPEKVEEPEPKKAPDTPETKPEPAPAKPDKKPAPKPKAKTAG